MNFKHLRNLCVAFVVLGLFACQEDSVNAPAIPDEVITKIENMGFNPDGIEVVEEGYRIERDIIISHEMLEHTPTQHTVPNLEQYATNNLVGVGAGRVITVYINAEDNAGNSTANNNGGPGNAKPPGAGGGNGGGGGGGADFSATYGAAVNEAISRYNAEGLNLTFERVFQSGADINFSRLSKRDERRGVLGSAGFPSASGNPYGTINMSGVLESSYGLSVNGIATIIAHEMGHCIGFRHTDYFDRSISCGGSPSNEGDAGIGANHIPQTPTGASLNQQSFMLSCTDGSNRPFNNDDKTALDCLYGQSNPCL